MLNSRAITINDYTTGSGERRITVTYSLPADSPVLQELHENIIGEVELARYALANPDSMIEPEDGGGPDEYPSEWDDFGGENPGPEEPTDPENDV